MKKSQKNKLLAISLAMMLGCILAIFALSACKSPTESSKPKVVSTIGMIDDIAKNIGKSHIDTQVLMGPGIDPHLYKASEGDTRRLGKADLILYNGLHLEARMGEVIEQMASRTKVVAVTKDIPETDLKSPPEFAGYHDPHVWFDVMLWIEASKTVESALIDLDPLNEKDYQKNAQEYRKALMELHQEIIDKISQIPVEKRVLITAHDAFGYFGARYNFEVVGLQGISTQAEAGAKDVQKLVNLIVSRKIPAIFIESSVPKRHIQAVQEAVAAKGWSVKIGGELYADAMGTAGTKEGTYIGMIKHNITTIVEALK
jgi:manganese/zinc/iron transport system substrate-binding protein